MVFHNAAGAGTNYSLYQELMPLQEHLILL